MDESSSSSRIKAALLVGLLLLVILAFASGFVIASVRPPQLQWRAFANAPEATSSSLNLFEEAWHLVKRDFYGPLPSNRQQIYSAVRGILNALDDPYTVFVEPIPRRFEQDDLRGSYGGIGVHLEEGDDGQIVLSPFRDSPAARAGVLEGDILLSIDSIIITPDLDLRKDIISRLRGEVGTAVTLTVRRDSESMTFTMIREVIEIPSVTWRTLDEDPTLGYLRISSFTDRTAGELKAGLEELYVGGAQGLVLDLRDNGGGLFQSSLDVADEFLDGGTLLYERRNGQSEKEYAASDGGHALNIPLVVLVNQGTASASEIVAGAIQDRERGVLIGYPTFGKGSVQLIFDLSDGSSLHVTAARWYTPDRHLIDGVGLTPNLVVEANPEDKSDKQLETAIATLQRGTSP